MRISKNIFSTTGKLLLPLLAIASVAYVGVALQHGSRADELTPSSSSAAVPATLKPTGNSNACCSLAIQTASITMADTQHVAVSVLLTNTSNALLQVSPGLQMSVIDRTGHSYNYTARYLPAGASIGGPLESGAHTTEKLDFDLPLNAQPWLLSFQPDASMAPINLTLPL